MGIVLLPIILALAWWCLHSCHRLITLSMQEESIVLPVRGIGWALFVIAPAVLWYFSLGYKLPVGGMGFFVGEFWGGIVGLPSILATAFALIRIGGSPMHLATSFAGGVLTPLFAAAAWTYTVHQPGFSMV